MVNVIDLADSQKEWDIENSIKKTGVKVLHHADEGETIDDMDYIAASKILSRNGCGHRIYTRYLCPVCVVSIKTADSN